MIKIAVDDNTLAEYAERMDFVAWTRPSDEKLTLRGFATQDIARYAQFREERRWKRRGGLRSFCPMFGGLSKRWHRNARRMAVE